MKIPVFYILLLLLPILATNRAYSQTTKGNNPERDYMDEYIDADDLPDHPEVMALLEEFTQATGKTASIDFMPVAPKMADLKANEDKSSLSDIVKATYIRMFRVMAEVSHRTGDAEVKALLEYRETGNKYFFPAPVLSATGYSEDKKAAAEAAYLKVLNSAGYKTVPDATPDLIKGLAAYFDVLKGAESAISASTNDTEEALAEKTYFIIYGHDWEKNITYCSWPELDSKTKAELEPKLKANVMYSSMGIKLPADQIVINPGCKILFNSYFLQDYVLAYRDAQGELKLKQGTLDYKFNWLLNEQGFDGNLIVKENLTLGTNMLQLNVTNKKDNTLHTKLDMQIDYGIINKNDYRVKVVRNGKNYYYEDGKYIGDAENGELPLKLNETIKLSLVQIDGQGNRKALENAAWLLSGSNDHKVTATVNSIKFSSNFTHTYIYAMIPGTNETITVNFDRENTPFKAPDPTGVTPRVDRLAVDSQNERKDLFNWAMSAIKEKNAGLYNFITSTRTSTDVYIVPAGDRDFAKYTEGVEGTILGVTYLNEYPNPLNFPLLDIDHPKVTGGVIESATLVAKLSKDELKIMAQSISSKTKTDFYEFFYGKIKSYSTESGTMLEKAMIEGAIEPDLLSNMMYKIGADDVDKFIDLVSFRKAVYLNDPNIKTVSNSNMEPFERTFTKTLAHEYMHLHFKLTNKLDYLTWLIIRYKNSGRYILKDKLGQNCACSAGQGHECHNPENIKVCQEEDKYNTLKRTKQ